MATPRTPAARPSRARRLACRAPVESAPCSYTIVMMPDPKDQPPRGSTSEAVTNNVRVEVESQYAPERSQPLQNEWFFHYTVRITNEGDDTVQLLSRHWVITDGGGQIQEVRGPGVVGEQPVLAPGES